METHTEQLTADYVIYMLAERSAVIDGAMYIFLRYDGLVVNTPYQGNLIRYHVEDGVKVPSLLSYKCEERDGKVWLSLNEAEYEVTDINGREINLKDEAGIKLFYPLKNLFG